jgi:hypothetical protein
LKRVLARDLIRFIDSTLPRLNDSEILPNTHRAQAHVNIGKADPEQTEPRPQHVTAIETVHARVHVIACRRFGKLIQKTASDMPKRMTTKSIAGE